eukprot:3446652-Pyramimonas_sp.AAC.1
MDKRADDWAHIQKYSSMTPEKITPGLLHVLRRADAQGLPQLTPEMLDKAASGMNGKKANGRRRHGTDR